jgi:hypothetical protein
MEPMSEGHRPTTGARLRTTLVAGSSALLLGSAALAVGDAGPAEAWHQEVYPVLNTPNWTLCAPGYSPPSRPAVAVNWATAVWDQHPELTVTQVCGGFNVFVQSFSYAEDWFGLNVCETWSGPDCTGMSIYLNARVIDATADPVHEWKQTACHEVGHIAGLGHRDPELTSCMASATASAGPDQHDFDDVAATYPR